MTRIALLTALSVMIAPTVAAQTLETLVETRRVDGNRPLSVEVRFAAGELSVQPSSSDRLYRVAMSYVAEWFSPSVSYDQGANRLDVLLDGNRDLRLDDLDDPDQTLAVDLPRDVPLDLSLAFGALQAEIELGGLTLRSAKIATGASETTLSFLSPTRGSCDRLELNVGAAEFDAVALGNSGCRTIELQGAIGQMNLDFSGDRWVGERRLIVKVGLGDVRLRIPQAIGVRLDADRFFASVSRAGLEKQGSAFVSPGFADAKAKLIIEVAAALGNVEIERIR